MSVTFRFLLLLMMLVAPSHVMASDCSSYPYTNGINIEAVPDGVKIISTGAVSVAFDDMESIKDARDEATLEAKAAISAFMSEGIQKASVVARAVKETKSMQGKTKVAARESLVVRVSTLASATQSLLRGVVPLGECYTKKIELRVSVGLKPETIKNAQQLSGSIDKPNEAASQAVPNAVGEPLQSPGSYSHTKRLKSF